MLVQLGPHVNVPGLDGGEDQLRHALPLLVDEVWLEQGLTGLEPLPHDLDDPAVGQGVLLHQEGGLLHELLLRVDVVANRTQFLLHHTDDCLEVCCVVESISSEEQQLDEVPGDVGHDEDNDI